MPFSSPFDESPQQVYQRILKGKINRFPPRLPAALQDLIRRLLSPDPLRRLGFRDYGALLTHPFFQGTLSSEGSIVQEKLVRKPFRVKVDSDYGKAPSIPKEIIFQFLRDSKGATDAFNIPDFTHYEQSSHGIQTS